MHLPRPLLIPVLLLLTGTVLAQARPGTGRRPAEPPPTCLVSEFRAMALGTHDLAERGKKAMEWLQRHSAACNEDQLRLLSSNRTQWLGNADSMALMAQIDGTLERRLKDKPEQLARMFGASTAPAKPAGDETLRAGALAPRPAPVVGPGTPAAVTVPPPVLVAGSAPALPAGAPTPPGATPPEPGKHFNDGMRSAVREYFTANRGSGACPTALVLKNNRCESAVSERPWKMGQPLPAQASTKDVPVTLLEKLGAPPPGHSYVQLDGDLLLIQTATRTVIDAVLDLGQVPPKA